MKLLSICIIIMFFGESCSIYKSKLIQAGDRNEAIQNAVIDFVNTSKLKKSDTIFSIHFYDTLYRMKLEKDTGYIYSWIPNKLYKNIAAVTISGVSGMKFLKTQRDTVGSIGTIPSRYIQINRFVFYWSDDKFPLTEETLAFFEHLNLLQDDEGGRIRLLERTIDDSKKGTHYYFCRNNLLKYKRIVTNIGIGYYNAPSVKCKN